MRFTENGPDIPNELLVARDEGRVVFFCGSGISKQAAKLPEFFELAEKVINELGVESSSYVRELIKLLNSTHDEGTPNSDTKLKAFVTADHLFSALEKDFDVKDIEKEVAKTLKEDEEELNLDFHEAVLNLSKTPDNRIQLITTNFDRLFEKSNEQLKIIEPSRLPSLSKEKLLDGVVHLHGLVNQDYSSSDMDGFVLSTGDFGEAYLSDAWATEFIKTVFDKFTVVFLGYSADDPPVHFLLAALKKKQNALKNVYAFSTSSKSDRWFDRGITPIEFDDYEQHLWPSIIEWARMTEAESEWLKEVSDLAQQDPAKLSSFERSKVAYLLSSFAGSKTFADLDPVPPADWLLVFDARERYKVEKRYSETGRNEYIKNWDTYGLDVDQLPPEIDSGRVDLGQNIPENAWNAFETNEQDLLELPENYFLNSFFWQQNFTPKRLLVLADWIGKVANQSVCVHWASRKNYLPQGVIRNISWQLDRFEKTETQAIFYRAWKYIFENYEKNQSSNERDYNWYDLENEAKEFGFSERLIRKLCESRLPKLEVNKPHLFFVKEDKADHEIQALSDLISINLNYNDNLPTIDVSSDYLAKYVSEMRLTLMKSVSLELETNHYFYSDIPTLFPSKNNDYDAYSMTHGISSVFFEYFRSFKNLLEVDLKVAVKESKMWHFEDHLFDRLIIWACDNKELVDNQQFNDFFSKMTRNDLWKKVKTRDLLLVLVKRWGDFNDEVQCHIESLLSQGREIETEDERNCQWQAYGVLNRITYLQENGCEFKGDVSEVITAFSKLVPEWNAANAKKSIEEDRTGVYSVKTDKTSEVLESLPIRNVLEVARNERGRSGEDFRVEMNPWRGLCEKKPIRALRVLSLAIEGGDYAQIEWSDLFSSLKSKPKLNYLLGCKFSSYPDQFFIENIYPLSSWFQERYEFLSTEHPKVGEKLFYRFISVFSPPIELTKTGIVRDAHSKIDWGMEAINSPVGNIAEALFNDPGCDNFDKKWQDKIEALLALKNTNKCYVLNTFSKRLGWFNYINEEWTDKYLFPIFFKGKPEQKKAIRQGFFKYQRSIDAELLEKISPALLNQIEQLDSDDDYQESLVAFLLLGWVTRDGSDARILSSEKVREIILASNASFRERVLWQLEIWYSKREKNNNWLNEVEVFFTEVWPKHKWIRSSKVTENICDILFEREDKFEVLFQTTGGLLSELTNQWNVSFIYEMLKREESEARKILENHTQSVLKLFFKVLPEDSVSWPYQTKHILTDMLEYDATLSSTMEYVDLIRRARL